MKKFLWKLIALSAVGMGAASLFAQTNLTQTTLSAAISQGGTTNIVVASATGITAPGPVTGAAFTSPKQTELVVDDEAMLVTAVNGTTISVVRGASGTSASPHASGAVVWVGSPSQFFAVAPTGSCTATGAVNPYLDLAHGGQYFCDSGTGNWQPLISMGLRTPGATPAAIGTSAQTFTVNGLSTGEPVTVVSQPAPASLCPLVAARVTAANTVSLYFTTLTAAACTPTAGTYLLLAPRLSMTH